MKSLHSAESGAKGITGSTRQHISSRLHKAIVYANQLVQLLDKADSGAASNAVLEARAYHVSLQGSSDFEKQKWENCLQGYSEARLIYTILGRSGNPKKDDIFRDLISSTVDPSIRYAAYQLKLSRTTSIDKIVARYLKRSNNEYVEQILESHPNALQESIEEKRKTPGEKTQDFPQTISWRSRTVNLEDAATAQALAAVSVAEQKLSSFLSSNPDLDSRAKAAAYDDVLLPSQDAVDATKTAIDELTADGVPQGDRRMQSLQITRTAVNYALVGWRIGRNRILCGNQDGLMLEDRVQRKPRKPRKDGKERVPQTESTNRRCTRLRERVVLYDAILQSLDSVKELPGVAADEVLVSEISSKRAYFASLRYGTLPLISPDQRQKLKPDTYCRCLSIAHAHGLLSHTKPALALFSRALSLSALVQPSSSPGSFKPPTLEIFPHQVTILQTHLQTLVARYRALADLASLAVPKPNPSALPLVERLDEYPEGGADLTNLVTYPPKVQPVPVKPIFLDVAWNYIVYPGKKPEVGKEELANGVEEKKEEKKEKKGWFGFGR